jgi:hypothetical protein
MKIFLSALIVAATPEKPPWWDVAWSTWALAIIGFFGTIAAVWTLLTIRRQTQAIETQVSEMRKTGIQTDELIREATVQSVAATRSAEALINSERAWVDGEFVKPEATKDWLEPDKVNPYISDPGYELKISNRGRTPAQIQSWELETLSHRSAPGGKQSERLTEHRTTRNLYALLSSGGTIRTEARIEPGPYTGNLTGTFKVTIHYLDLVTGSLRPHKTVFVYQAERGHLERISVCNEYT